MSKRFALQVLLTGLFVGTLDIGAALLQFFLKTGKDPMIVMKFIASGLFGKEAMKGGDEMIVWGFLFHYLLAIGYTIFFFWICSQIPSLLQHRLLTGIGYGIFVWAVMRFAILPLSLTTKQPSTLSSTLIAILILVVCMGIPLAYVVAAVRKRAG